MCMVHSGMGQPPPLHVGRQSVFMSSFTLCTLLTPANVLRPLSCTSWSSSPPRTVGGAVWWDCVVGAVWGTLCAWGVVWVTLSSSWHSTMGTPLDHQQPPVQPIKALLADFVFLHIHATAAEELPPPLSLAELANSLAELDISLSSFSTDY